MENGISGYLVSSVEDCAARAVDILNDPSLGRALGRRGKEFVRTHFLMPRYLRDYLRIFGELLEAAPPTEAATEPVAEPAPVHEP